MKITLKTAFGFPALSLLLPCVLLCLQAGCTTNRPTAAALQPLQGTWEGVRRVGQESDDGKLTITITGNSLHYQDSTNEWHKGTFTLPAGTHPQELRLTLTGSSLTNGPGALVRASMKIEDGTLTLAPSGGGPDEPPKSFEDKDMILYELKKVQPQQKNAAASTSRVTTGDTNQCQQRPQIPGIARALESGRKHPAEMAKIASGPSLVSTPMVFQNNSAGIRLVCWLDRNGERQLYRDLQPGESYEIGTYVSHPWVITDADGNALALYYPDGQKRTVTLE